MKPICLYPGQFSPPTFGHLAVVRNSAEILPYVTVLCSTNEEKAPLFTESEAMSLWSAYRLPANVDVKTFGQAIAEKIDLTKIVMIRGMRGEQDAEHELRVMLRNKREYGISRFMEVMADKDTMDVSSTAAREAARELDFLALARMAAPLVVSALLERVHGLKRLFLVVGRPGGGKSTLLRSLAKLDPTCVHVDTDRFLDDTKPALRAKFGTDDLVGVATTRGEELKAAVSSIWTARCAEAIRNAPKGCRLFLEVPYALSPDMALYRLLGGRVIHIGCSTAEHVRRIQGRGTPQHLEFLDRIPDWDGAVRVAEANLLSLTRVRTDGGMDQMDAAAAGLLRDISA